MYDKITYTRTNRHIKQPILKLAENQKADLGYDLYMF